jgi:hypothetical protein
LPRRRPRHFRHDGIVGRSDRAHMTPAPRAGLSMQPPAIRSVALSPEQHTVA